MDKTPHQIALEIVAEEKDRNFNEADTRHKIIDEVLHKVLSWPVKLTLHESYIHEGYADYRLKKVRVRICYLLRQKKKGSTLTCPITLMGIRRSGI